MRIALEHLFAEYPVTVDRYCDDARDDRQSVMIMACAVWASEHGVDAEVHWDPDRDPQPKGLKAVFLVLFSVASYALEEAVRRYRAREKHCAIIVCGPHALSFPDHCYRAGADAVVGLCNRELFLEILDDVRDGCLARHYATTEPVARFPDQRTFREHGVAPPQSFMNVVASTGCPYTCSFCSDATTRYQPQAVEAVLQNIESSDERIVVFNDPLFGLGPQGQAILEGLTRMRDRYFIAFTTGSLLATGKFRRQLADAHFLMVEVGLENIHSPFAKNRRVDFFEALADCDFLVMVNYIFGLNPADFEESTTDYLVELCARCPNVIPMVFVPFSLPEAPSHAEDAIRLFDRSPLCIGNEILSMRVPVDSPAAYYARLDALNERLYDGHSERLRRWVREHPHIPEERRQVLREVVERHVREAERATAWSELLTRHAPNEWAPFALDVLAAAVPDFHQRYANGGSL